jgi:hypothetical protein
MASVQINGIPWDYQNIQTACGIYEKIGNNVRALVTDVPLGRALRSITYKDSLECDDMFGSSRQADDQTDGVGSYEAGFEIEKWGDQLLIASINQLGDGYGRATVRITLSMTFYKTGFDTWTDTISLARIISSDDSHKRGKDALMVQYSLKPHRVYKAGRDQFGEKAV